MTIRSTGHAQDRISQDNSRHDNSGQIHDRLVPSRATQCCAQCGELLFLPEWSEHLDEDRVRHLWICEACDYCFETTVRFAHTVSLSPAA
jgi:hypothetical protein